MEKKNLKAWLYLLPAMAFLATTTTVQRSQKRARRPLTGEMQTKPKQDATSDL